MRIVYRLLIALATALGLSLVVAVPAFAASSFTFEGFFKHRLDTREYNANQTGYHDFVKTDANCPGVGNLMRVRLVEERLRGDKEYPWQLLTCNNSDQTRAFYATSDGDHHFTIEKEDTDSKTRAWYIAGRVNYPPN